MADNTEQANEKNFFRAELREKCIIYWFKCGTKECDDKTLQQHLSFIFAIVSVPTQKCSLKRQIHKQYLQ